VYILVEERRNTYRYFIEHLVKWALGRWSMRREDNIKGILEKIIEIILFKYVPTMSS
jgi:hypothetical protein